MFRNKTLLALALALSVTFNAYSQNYSWEALYGSNNLQGVNGNVYAFTSYQGKTVVGGGFTVAAGVTVKNVAMYDPATRTWSALGLDLGTGSSDTVRALEVYNNELYAGGIFTALSGAVNIAKWNGTAWVPVGPGADGEVNALKVYNARLIAGGEFGNIGNRIAAWNGSTWSQLGSGISTSGGSRVLAMTIYNSNLVAAGRFTTAGGNPANSIAMWNDTNWTSLSSNTDERIHSVAVHNGELFAGGRFTIIGGVSASYIARYNGSVWLALAGGNLDNRVFAIASYSSTELIVGGQFKNAGSLYVNYAAKWNGTSWSRMVTGMDEKIQALYKIDTSVYAGGEFNIAGGLIAHHVARWYNRLADTVSGTVRYADNNQLVPAGRVWAVRKDYFTNEVIVVDSGTVVNGLYRLIGPPVFDTLRVILLPDDELDFVPTYYPSAIDWLLAGTIVPGQNTNNIDVNVYRITPGPLSNPSAVIHGTIHLNITIPLDPPGSYPYRSKSVLYVKQNNSFRRFAVSANNESYATTSLSPGTYELLAFRLGYCMQSAVLTIEPNTTDTAVNFTLDTCSVIGIHTASSEVPSDFLLKQNYPNPFNPATLISFSIPSAGFVELRVYDILGREVEVLVGQHLDRGSYKYIFDGGTLPSGIYFYTLTAKDFSQTKKMILIK